MATDHTVSSKKFPIWKCESCTGMFTQDVPDKHDIASYYKSEAYISHSNSKEGIVNKLYHVVRNHTVSEKRKLLQTVTRNRKGRLLDIGAGTGFFAGHMQQSGWEVTALEPDSSARQTAFELYGLKAEPAGSLFSLPDKSFDVITMWHVLEHVHELHEYLDKCRTLLKPGGTLIIAVPNYTSADADRYQQFWAAYDVPRHLYHFSPLSMKKLVERHFMEVKKMKAMWFDSFYVSMLSEQYRLGRPNLAGGIMAGLSSNWAALKKRSVASSIIYIIKNRT